MGRVVADSNVIIKWFIIEDYSEYAKMLRNDHLMGHVEVVLPIYALLEIYNTLRKYLIRGFIREEELYKIIELLHEVRIHFMEITRDLLDEALSYSIKNHVTVYDAYYIVLAHKLNTVFYTADEKLLKRLEGKEPRVRHIKEYSSATVPSEIGNFKKSR